MKVFITAASGQATYPTICGKHDFENIEKAIDFARFGANRINPGKGDNLILEFSPPYYFKVDIVITIYDDYVE